MFMTFRQIPQENANKGETSRKLCVKFILFFKGQKSSQLGRGYLNFPPKKRTNITQNVTETELSS